MSQTPQKKEYDNSYKKGKYQEFRETKDRISAENYGGKCYLCGATEKSNHYHLHHLEYHPEDSSYIRNSKAQWTRNLRVQEAVNNPDRFVLLCAPCHRMVTTLGTHLLKKVALARQARDIDLVKLLNLVLIEAYNRKEEGEPDA